MVHAGQRIIIADVKELLGIGQSLPIERWGGFFVTCPLVILSGDCLAFQARQSERRISWNAGVYGRLVVITNIP
jgi:hypothetical protein